MSKNVETAQSRQERLNEIFNPDSFIERVWLAAMAIMGAVGFGIFAGFVALAVKGQL